MLIKQAPQLSRTLAVTLAAWMLAALPQQLAAREWNDATGQFSVDAELVTADDERVVLKAADGELITLRRDQLAPEDAEYVAQRLESESGPDPTVDAAGGQPPLSTTRGWLADSTWQLRGGEMLRGRLLGFGSQTLVVERRRGEVFVDGRMLQNLPQAYEILLPEIVSHLDGRPIAGLDELQAYLADAGGGPLKYRLEGVQLELDSGDVVTIPLALLEREDALQLAPGLARWMAAQADELPDQSRRDVARRERLFLDSFARYPGPGTAPLHQMRLLQLQLLAAEAGITDLWEVLLYPNVAYGYPYTVVVPAENSRIARLRAMREYPGWRVVTMRKLSR